MPRTRVALYSHDTVGLGHTRRQLAIAEQIVRTQPEADLLLVTGNPEASRLPIPQRTDLLTRPTVTKTAEGDYVPRRMGTSLEDVVALRSAVITAGLDAFDPDLLIVDKVAGGLQGELRPALELLQGRTRMVLGLREILDSPAATARDMHREGTADLVEEFYDEVWAYGDPEVFDPVTAYGWTGALADRLISTGYLRREVPTRDAWSPGPTPPPYVLCQMGGGADGSELAEAFLRAPLPDGHTGVLLIGPYLPEAEVAYLETLASDRHRLLRFVANPEEHLAGASAVISMAGYNSTVELLASSVPALLVPRVTPRREQLLRARALAEQGSVDMLLPEELDPASLGAWMDRATVPHSARTRRSLHCRSRVDLGGLDRLTTRTTALIGELHDAA
jgi:predicted glycosyltransferase